MTSDIEKNGFRLNSKVKVKKVESELQALLGYGDGSLLNDDALREAALDLYLSTEG